MVTEITFGLLLYGRQDHIPGTARGGWFYGYGLFLYQPRRDRLRRAAAVKVLKCINNNVVSCLGSDGRELVAMGRGLGFSLRPGDEVEESRAEKLFRMESSEETQKLTDLFAKLQPREIELCSRIVDKAMEDLGQPLSPSVYLTLTDHVSFAIERHRKGFVFTNTLLAEVRTFYPREFALGKFALELIFRELGIQFPDDEAANIALHLVNAEYENSLSDTLRITQTLHDSLSLLAAYPGLRLDSEGDFYNEFTVQLKFLVFRAFSHTFYQRREERYVRAVELCYPQEFQCAQEIAVMLADRCGQTVPPAELAFLAASLHRTLCQVP